MTVLREGEEMTLHTDRPHLGRTFAMTVVSSGYGVMTVGLAYFLIAIAGAVTDDLDVGAIMFIAITAIVAVVGAISLVWSGARQRSWFWLMAVLPGLLVLLMNAPYLARDIVRPTSTENFLLTMFVLAGGLAIIFGGIVAFVEVRRGRVAWTRFGRAGWIAVVVVGVLVGAAATSALAGSAAAGAGVAEEPNIAGVLTAENTAFVETTLQMTDGEVLGLFLINKDDIAHSFDIDSLDIHVDLPANTTTAVAIKPIGPGSLEFFCGVPGHREAGMVGTIDVTS